jgi:Ser/Thr protein kinase RdoA (MazF antagonist)
MTLDEENKAFAALGPDSILDAVEGSGRVCDGRFLALNSYENRVYQVGIEDGVPLVVKFYRPGRWSDAAIVEEHRFALALAEQEIPVVAPLLDEHGDTLHRHGPFRFALYPRRGGRAPDLEDPAQLIVLGRFLGRIHAVGEVQPFVHRPTLDIQHFAVESYQFILQHGWIPPELQTAYRTLAEDLVRRAEACFGRAGAVAGLRLHGDCHPGNILWTEQGPHIVDFDDARMGPAVQDLWMFLSGDRTYRAARLADLLEGYTEFHDFDARELHLVEPLRTLRMMHYAAWIARRWDDPAFPRAFPWFAGGRFWEEHILTLREQAAAMDEPPLVWD